MINQIIRSFPIRLTNTAITLQKTPLSRLGMIAELAIRSTSLAYTYGRNRTLVARNSINSSLTEEQILKQELTRWENEPGIDRAQVKARKTASERILNCYDTQSQELHLVRLGLTSLPNLTPLRNLQLLVCSANQLTELPQLPDSLGELVCRNNQLIKLPELPVSLQLLDCDNNHLIVLPQLPASLQALSCERNRLIILPQLPAALNLLNCGNNHLIALPQLPASLKALYCDGNWLTTLPQLPDFLKILNCGNNGLITLPELPISLEHLYCNNNHLTALPQLAATLQSAYFENNPFDSLANIHVLSGVIKDMDEEVLIQLGATIIPEEPFWDNNHLTPLPPLPVAYG